MSRIFESRGRGEVVTGMNDVESDFRDTCVYSSLCKSVFVGPPLNVPVSENGRKREDSLKTEEGFVSGVVTPAVRSDA